MPAPKTRTWTKQKKRMLAATGMTPKQWKAKRAIMIQQPSLRAQGIRFPERYQRKGQPIIEAKKGIIGYEMKPVQGERWYDVQMKEVPIEGIVSRKIIGWPVKKLKKHPGHVAHSSTREEQRTFVTPAHGRARKGARISGKKGQRFGKEKRKQKKK